MAFLKRSIDVLFFHKKTGENILTVKDAYVTCDISDVAGESAGQLVMVIYGLSQSSMNRISSDGLSVSEVADIWCRVTVSSEDVTGKRTQNTAYEGFVFESVTDYNNAPSPTLTVTCQSSAPLALKAQDATSFNGSVAVGQAISSILKDSGFLLDINDGGAVIENLHVSGSALEQLSQACHAAALRFVISNGKVKVFPITSEPPLGDVPVLSPDTGMVGYPVVSGTKICLKAIYNNAFAVPDYIKIKSSIGTANGVFQMVRVSHHIEVNSGGDAQFFSIIEALRTR